MPLLKHKTCALIAHSAKIAIKLLYLYLVVAVLIGVTLRTLLDRMYQEPEQLWIPPMGLGLKKNPKEEKFIGLKKLISL